VLSESPPTALHFNQETWTAILDSIDDAVYCVDTRRQITFWNHQAEVITGYARQQAIGHLCADGVLSHCDESGEILCFTHCPLQAALDSQKPHATRAYLRHHDGHRVPVFLRVVPTYDPDGELSGAAQVFRLKPASEGDFLSSSQPAALHVHPHSAHDRLVTERLLSEKLAQLETNGGALGIIRVAPDDPTTISKFGGALAVRLVEDTLLRTLADNLRRQDVLGMWSGHQFLAILHDVNQDLLDVFAKHLHMVCSHSTYTWWGEEHSLPVCLEARLITASCAGEALEWLAGAPAGYRTPSAPQQSSG
jgi:PAS domain S-box-containing protein